MTSVVALAFSFVTVGLCVFGLGCAAHVTGFAEAEPSTAFDDEPTLVAVEPGLWVVRRYPTVIYHVDGCYWTASNGYWYRSTTWDGTWVHAEAAVIPASIERRDHSRYVYYEGHHGSPTRAVPPGLRDTPGLRRGSRVSEAPLPRAGVVATVVSRQVIERDAPEPKSRREGTRGELGRGRRGRH
jgi:hypothetical protein